MAPAVLHDIFSSHYTVMFTKNKTFLEGEKKITCSINVFDYLTVG